MTLLAPALLLGLVGLSLPIVAHLLGRETPRRIRFAAVRFLSRVEPSVTHRRAIQDIPLLLIRALLLALLVAIVARPASPRSEALAVVGVPHDAVILLDASYSLEIRHGGRTMVQRAIDRATEVVKALPPGSHVGLVTSDPDGARIAVSDARAPVLGALEDWDEEILRPPGAWVLAEGLPPAVAALSASTDAERPRVVYAVSDATSNGLGSLPENAADGVLLVPVLATDAPAPSHVGVVDASWEPAPELDPRAVRVMATLRRMGGQGPSRVPLALLVADREVARTEVELEPNSRKLVEFTHSLLESTGPTPATLRVNVPDDALPVDDARHLWLSADEATDVTIVNGDPSELRSHDETFFLTTALAAAGDDMRVRIRMLAPDQLEDGMRARPDLLNDTDVLILANAPAPAETVTPGIVAAVDAGMGLLITVGDRVVAEDYNPRLGKVLPLHLREDVLLGTLPGRAEARSEGLAPPDLGHPMFAGIAGEMGLSGTRTRKIFLLEPDATRQAQVPVTFTGGAPALVTRLHGAGRVALLTTTLDRDWSDLPLRPGFLPLAQKAVAWLGDAAYGGSGGGGAQLLVGESRTLRADDSVTVTTPGGERLVLAPNPDAQVILSDTTVPGHYQVIGSRRHGTEVFAVNLDPTEGDTAAVWQAKPISPASGGLQPVASWQPRWHGLVLAAAILLALEAILRSLRGRRRRRRRRL